MWTSVSNYWCSQIGQTLKDKWPLGPNASISPGQGSARSMLNQKGLSRFIDQIVSSGGATNQIIILSLHIWVIWMLYIWIQLPRKPLFYELKADTACFIRASLNRSANPNCLEISPRTWRNSNPSQEHATHALFSASVLPNLCSCLLQISSSFHHLRARKSIGSLFLEWPESGLRGAALASTQ